MHLTLQQYPHGFQQMRTKKSHKSSLLRDRPVAVKAGRPNRGPAARVGINVTGKPHF
jgi:hypothetical protein